MTDTRDFDHTNGSKLPIKESNDDDAASETRQSQTASDFINKQLQLEADAREALPYTFDHCTQPLGPLKQTLFSCLTCNPPPSSADSSEPFTPAAVCYSCSIACHGQHTLVELFNRRNFTCDCGTTRLPSTSPCTLRIDPRTGLKGPVHSEQPAEGNTYNKNCKNHFCGCGEVYDAHQEKGTMFQCLGLAQEKDGGCGEDWWHPECVIGVGREQGKANPVEMGSNAGIADGVEAEAEDHPLPPGFPREDDFESFICYKCVEVNPWIKRYAGTKGFLPAVYKKDHAQVTSNGPSTDGTIVDEVPATSSAQESRANSPKKRTADDAGLDESSLDSKKSKPEGEETNQSAYHNSLPSASSAPLSLFMKEDFRDHFCRCRECYSQLSRHPQLLEEETSYEPPLSEDGEEEAAAGGSSKGSLLDRGEAALSNVDRVKAIEGVMVYNHLKDKVKSFLQPFAESGQAVGAEDIKAYFEKLRGDEQGIKEAGAASAGDDGDSGGDSNRKEQSGY